MKSTIMFSIAALMMLTACGNTAEGMRRDYYENKEEVQEEVND